MTVTEPTGFRRPEGWSVSTAFRVGVRKAAPEELPAIGEMLERAYAASYQLDEHYRQELRHLERFAPHADVWAAFEDDRPVGALVVPARGEPGHYVAGPPEPELGFRMLGVDPDFRGRGIAQTLIEFVAALARERGMRRIGIYSGEHMLQAHGLYRRLGFIREPWRDTTVHATEMVRLFAFALLLNPPASGGGPS
ncbi:MAG: GNAT family N-acetyltransferase [Bifidobacteriaceae bacterium]|jgi:GNAT superfamily N-acetyltransferase|nr:GNAT family N-acetyltransferase [Bifidobacteriaceae bacterium]